MEKKADITPFLASVKHYIEKAGSSSSQIRERRNHLLEASKQQIWEKYNSLQRALEEDKTNIVTNQLLQLIYIIFDIKKLKGDICFSENEKEDILLKNILSIWTVINIDSIEDHQSIIVRLIDYRTNYRYRLYILPLLEIIANKISTYTEHWNFIVFLNKILEKNTDFWELNDFFIRTLKTQHKFLILPNVEGQPVKYTDLLMKLRVKDTLYSESFKYNYTILKQIVDILEFPIDQDTKEFLITIFPDVFENSEQAAHESSFENVKSSLKSRVKALQKEGARNSRRHLSYQYYGHHSDYQLTKIYKSFFEYISRINKKPLCDAIKSVLKNILFVSIKYLSSSDYSYEDDLEKAQTTAREYLALITRMNKNPNTTFLALTELNEFIGSVLVSLLKDQISYYKEHQKVDESKKAKKSSRKDTANIFVDIHCFSNELIDGEKESFENDILLTLYEIRLPSRIIYKLIEGAESGTPVLREYCFVKLIDILVLNKYHLHRHSEYYSNPYSRYYFHSQPKILDLQAFKQTTTQNLLLTSHEDFKYLHVRFESLPEYRTFFNSITESAQNPLGKRIYDFLMVMLQDATRMASSTPAWCRGSFMQSNITFGYTQKCVSDEVGECIALLNHIYDQKHLGLLSPERFDELLHDMLIRQFELSIGDTIRKRSHTAKEDFYEFNPRLADVSAFYYKFKTESCRTNFVNAIMDVVLKKMVLPQAKPSDDVIGECIQFIEYGLEGRNKPTHYWYFLSNIVDRALAQNRHDIALAFFGHISNARTLDSSQQQQLITKTIDQLENLDDQEKPTIQRNQYQDHSFSHSKEPAYFSSFGHFHGSKKQNIKKKLRLQDNLWSNAGLWIALQKPDFQAVVYLDLSNNAMDHDKMGQFVPKLKALSALMHLDLSHNAIGRSRVWYGLSGAQMLANALPQLTALQSLKLDKCELHSQDVESFALPSNQLTSLTHLSLNHNALGQYAYHENALADFLSISARNLKVLELADNDISRESAVALLKAQPSGDTKTTFSLANNPAISEDVLGVFRAQSKLHGELVKVKTTPKNLTQAEEEIQRRLFLWQAVCHHWNQHTHTMTHKGQYQHPKRNVFLRRYQDAVMQLQAYIESEPKLYQFYAKIYIDLEARFLIVFKTLSTRLIYSDVASLTSAVGAGVVGTLSAADSLSGFLFSTPIPVASTLASGVQKVVEVEKMVKNEQYISHTNRLSEMGSLKEYGYLIQQLALSLTMSYQSIILSLSAEAEGYYSEEYCAKDQFSYHVSRFLEEEWGARKKRAGNLIKAWGKYLIGKKILQLYPQTNIQQLAQFMVMKLQMKCLYGEFQPDDKNPLTYTNFVERFLHLVISPSTIFLEMIKEFVKHGLGISQVVLQKMDGYENEVTLSLHEVCSNPGLVNLLGETYAFPGRTDLSCRYIYGSQQDAMALQFEPAIIDHAKAPYLPPIPMVLQQFLGLHSSTRGKNALDNGIEYDKDIIFALFHGVKNVSHLIRVVFKPEISWKLQLKKLSELTYKLKRPGIFLSQIPSSSNHWIMGIINDNSLLLVDPQKMSENHQSDYLEDLETLSIEISIRNYISTPSLLLVKEDFSGIVVLEIAIQLICELAPKVFDQWWNKRIMELSKNENFKGAVSRIKFKDFFQSASKNEEIITELETLSDNFDAEQNMIEIRRAHYHRLQDIGLKHYSLEKTPSSSQTVFESYLNVSNNPLEIHASFNSVGLYGSKHQNFSTTPIPSVFHQGKSQQLNLNPQFLKPVWQGMQPNQKTYDFHEVKIAEDGHCGFTLLRVSREALVEALLKLSDKPENCEFLVLEIKNAFVSGDVIPFSSEWKNLLAESCNLDENLTALLQQIKQKYPEAESIKKEDMLIWLQQPENHRKGLNAWQILTSKVKSADHTLNQYCMRKEVFEYYVKAYIKDDPEILGKKLWLGLATALLYAKHHGIQLFIWEKDAKKANQLTLKRFENSNPQGEVIHGFFTGGSRHFNQLLPIKPALDADNTDTESLESTYPQKALKPHCDTIPLCQSAVVEEDDSWMNIPAFQLLLGELNAAQDTQPYDYNFSSKREISRLREKSKEDAIKFEALRAKNAELEQKNLGLANTVSELNSDIVDLKANQEKLETNYALLLERLEAMERERGHGHAPNL